MLIKTLLCLSAIFYWFVTSAIANIDLTQSEKELVSQGKVIVREVPTSDKKGRTFQAVGLIRADVNEVYQVLTRFEDYSKYMPHVRVVEILKRDAGSATLNYTLTLPLGKTKKYRLGMTFKNYESQAMLKWKMIEWPDLKESETIKDTTGYWLLENYPEKEGYVIALYHVYTDPGHIPWYLRWIVDFLTKKSVPDVVEKTRARVYDLYKN